MNARIIGKTILAHRKASGLSRIACADLAGVGKTVIYDIEHGKETVQLNTLLSIMKVLNIEMKLESPIIDKIQINAKS